MTTEFNYNDLDAKVADEAKAAAERIKGAIKKERNAIIEIGRDLIAMKDKLGHGNFGKWIDAEFDMSPSSAERYMHVAERIGDKIVSLTNLKRETIYALAATSTPDEMRSEVIDLVAGGKMSDADARERITAARKQAKPTKAETPGAVSAPPPPAKPAAEVINLPTKTPDTKPAFAAASYLYDKLKQQGTDAFLNLMRDAGNNWPMVLAELSKIRGGAAA
jgi:hypothetical protein